MRKNSTRMLALALSVVTAVSSLTGFGGDVKAHAAENPSAVVAEVDEATPGDASPTDTKIDASEYSVALGITSYVYDGGAKTPTVKITDDKGEVLKINEDYTVAYTENIIPGTAYVKITYKGKYAGTAQKSFKIDPASIGSVKTTTGSSSIKLVWGKTSGVSRYVVTQYKNGKWQSVYTGAALTATIKNLSANTSYKFQITGQRKLKSGKYVSVAKSAGIAAGTDRIAASSFAVSLSKKSCSYDGTAKKPTVKINGKVGGKTVTLKRGIDYTYTYVNNIYPGTATVKVNYKGQYKGSKSTNFKITVAEISKITSTQTSNSITLKWNEVKGATKYEVYMYKSGKWNVVCNSTTGKATVGKLDANKGYKFVVKAYGTNAGKKVLIAQSSRYIEYTRPSKVIGVSLGDTYKNNKKIIISNSENAVRLNWKYDKGVSGYKIYVYNTATHKWTEFKKASQYCPADSSSTGRIYYYLRGLKPATTYMFKIVPYTKNVDYKTSTIKTYVGEASDVIKTATIPKVKYGFDECYELKQNGERYDVYSQYYNIEFGKVPKNSGYYIRLYRNRKYSSGTPKLYKTIKVTTNKYKLQLPKDTQNYYYYFDVVSFTNCNGKTFTGITERTKLQTKIGKLAGKVDSYTYSILRNKNGKIVEQTINSVVRSGKTIKNISKQYDANMKYLGKAVTLNDKYRTSYFYNSKDKLINYQKYILDSSGKIIGTALYNPSGKIISKNLWPSY